MKDPRMTRLAELLVRHSTRLQPGENVLVEAFDIPPDCTAELVRVAQEAGANVFVDTYHAVVQRRFLLGVNESVTKAQAEWDKARMEHMQAYVGLRGGHNYAESSDVPDETLKMWLTHYAQPVHFQTRVPKTKWVVLRWPSPSMAQQAGMSTEAFEDFYFEVCTADYAKMAKAVEPLQELMSKTDRVRLVGPGTDLTFSIKDIPCVPCCGEMNIPDGEIFTAPVKESVNGVITFNTESLRDGTVFSGVRLVVKDGKVVEAEAQSKSDKLNSILDTDEGARYFGEFAIGFNPYVLHPMKDTLFDEKIAGSFHLTPGNAYDEADNGNKSSVHWDFVCIQRADYGGGEMYFDDVLVRKDGLFVLPELQPLNPENLR
ncbi:MAG: aminopeptidase [Fimbriimonadales bacterium]